MNAGRTIFSQLMEFLSTHDFRLCVERYNGNYKIKSFSCWDQYLCMAFAQLTYRESLRDIQVCLRSAHQKLYHMGIRGKVSRNTLAHANQVRDWRIYADFAQGLIGEARKLYANDSLARPGNSTPTTPSASSWIRASMPWTQRQSTCACRSSPGPRSASTRGL